MKSIRDPFSSLNNQSFSFQPVLCHRLEMCNYVIGWLLDCVRMCMTCRQSHQALAVCCVLCLSFLAQHHASTLSLKPPSLFFSWRVTTAICHTKNTLKETVFTKQQYTLIPTSSVLIFLFPPTPPSAAMSWENSMDNTVHAPESCKSVSRKSLLIQVRLAKGGWEGMKIDNSTSSLIMEMRMLNW